jgi:hypothetical protein
MADERLENYVRSALALQGYDFNAERTENVIAQFERIEALAQVLLAVELPLGVEPAPVFRP